jgi:Mg-chelatase subunit ChlD
MRTQILEKNEAFAEDPYSFMECYLDGLARLKEKIIEARKNLGKIEVPEETYTKIAETCLTLKVDGFRPDIVATHVAKSLAAYKGKTTIDSEDIETALVYTLGHRTRRSGLVQPPSPLQIKKAYEKTRNTVGFEIDIDLPEITRKLSSNKIIEEMRKIALNRDILTLFISILMVGAIAYNLETFRKVVTTIPTNNQIIVLEVLTGLLATLLLNKFLKNRGKEKEVLGFLDFSEINIRTKGKLQQPGGVLVKEGGSLQAKVLYEKDETKLDHGIKILQNLDSRNHGKKYEKPGTGKRLRINGASNGRRTRAISSSSRGKYTWYKTPKGKPRDIALIPTIRIAALNQNGKQVKGLKSRIRSEDIRVKVREHYAPFSVMLLVDMSLSMISSVNNIVETIYSLHKDVYRRRDKVGLIVFKGSKAYTLQHPTRNLDLVVKKLQSVGASDYTPLAAGLFQAWKTLKQEKLRNKDAVPYLYIISDGIVNVPLETPLSPLTRRRFNSEAQADSFDVAHLLSKYGIKIIVFNTNHSETEADMYPLIETNQRVKFTPTQFLMHLAKITNGEYRGLRRHEVIPV